MARTMGTTRDCGGCRYWSEMLAQCHGGGPVTAMCLTEKGAFTGKYTHERQTCASWASGHLGAVDDPPDYGEETRAAYAREAEAPRPTPELIDIVGIMGALKEATETLRPKRKRRVR